MSSLFVNDPSFCSVCGAILPLPGSSDKIECRLCHFNHDSKGFHSWETRALKMTTQKCDSVWGRGRIHVQDISSSCQEEQDNSTVRGRGGASGELLCSGKRRTVIKCINFRLIASVVIVAMRRWRTPHNRHAQPMKDRQCSTRVLGASELIPVACYH